jgi:16S rRNA (guanine527-N7)-methyltransferase
VDTRSLCSAARTLGVSLSNVQLEALALFEERLYEANTLMNLTRVPKAECWARHFLDSLTLSPLIPKGASVLDIGTGPGIPGACLAIARPDLTVTLMDSAGKEIGFLRTLFGPQGALPVLFQVIQARAEDAGRDPKLREAFDFVTGRAVAPLSEQAEISAPFVKVGGAFVPMRTPNDKQAARFPCERLGLKLIEEHLPVLQPISATRYLPVYKKVGRTPTEYPRAWAQIKARPL